MCSVRLFQCSYGRFKTTVRTDVNIQFCARFAQYFSCAHVCRPLKNHMMKASIEIWAQTSSFVLVQVRLRLCHPVFFSSVRSFRASFSMYMYVSVYMLRCLAISWYHFIHWLRVLCCDCGAFADCTVRKLLMTTINVCGAHSCMEEVVV